MNRNLHSPSPASGQAPKSAVDYIIEREQDSDGKVMRWALCAAMVVHAVLFVAYSVQRRCKLERFDGFSQQNRPYPR